MEQLATRPDARPLGPAELVGMYRVMQTIRRAEEEVLRALTAGEAAFTYYPVRGQEAIAAGLSAVLRSDDYLLTTYRCLHDLVGKGVPLPEIVAEMHGRVTGTSKGKGGAMHISDPSSGLMVTTGVVGSHLPIGNGLGLASQLLGDDRVTVVSFGDGATSIGACHEALNLASLWQLPVVFVCQNNQWGECTPQAGYTRTERLAERAAPYGMPGVTCDGNDPEAVAATIGAAVQRARRGEGPTLVECLTNRHLGHYFGDQPEVYIPADELAAIRALDPVEAFRARLLGDASTAGLLAAVDDEVDRAVQAAFDFARSSPVPDETELCRDVFASEEEIPEWL